MVLFSSTFVVFALGDGADNTSADAGENLVVVNTDQVVYNSKDEDNGPCKYGETEEECEGINAGEDLKNLKNRKCIWAVDIKNLTDSGEEKSKLCKLVSNKCNCHKHPFVNEYHQHGCDDDSKRTDFEEGFDNAIRSSIKQRSLKQVEISKSWKWGPCANLSHSGEAGGSQDADAAGPSTPAPDSEDADGEGEDADELEKGSQVEGQECTKKEDCDEFLTRSGLCKSEVCKTLHGPSLFCDEATHKCKYTCWSGEQIIGDDVCNRNKNCQDGSDENACLLEKGQECTKQEDCVNWGKCESKYCRDFHFKKFVCDPDTSTCKYNCENGDQQLDGIDKICDGINYCSSFDKGDGGDDEGACEQDDFSSGSFLDEGNDNYDADNYA